GNEGGVSAFSEKSAPHCADESYTFSMDEAFLQRLATLNPVATTLLREQMAEAIFTELAGMPPRHKRRKSQLIDDNTPHRGIFGTPWAWHFVTETNGRKSFHFHAGVIAGASPTLLADVAGYPRLEAAVHAALDSMYTAHVPADLHAIDVARRTLRIPAERQTFFQTTDTPTPEAVREFHIDAAITALTTGLHSHAATCHKGKNGKLGCRMAKPSGHPVPQSRVLAILPDEPAQGTVGWSCKYCTPGRLRDIMNMPRADLESLDPSAAHGMFRDVCRELSSLLSRPIQGRNLNDCLNSCSQDDARAILLAWHGMRCRNAALVDFSPTLSGCVRSNTAPLHLGAREAAKGAGMYMVKNLVKEAPQHGALATSYNEFNSSAAELAPTQAAAIALGVAHLQHLHHFRRNADWIALSQADHYAHRSQQLADLTFDEFVMGMRIQKVSAEQRAKIAAESGKRGRPTNPSFELEPPLPLAGQYVIREKSKFDVPVFVGAPPPRLPPDSAPRNKARQRMEVAHAEYFTALFVPWSAAQLETATPTTWSAYQRRLEDAAHGSAPPASDSVRHGKSQRIAEGRLFRIHHVATALTSNTRKTDIMSKWRMRDRTLWSETTSCPDVALPPGRSKGQETDAAADIRNLRDAASADVNSRAMKRDDPHDALATLRQQGLRQVHLLQGAGGVGKSVLLKAMHAVLRRLHLGHMAITAWTGVASAPFGAPTLCSLLKIDFACLAEDRPVDADTLQLLRKDFADAMCDPADLLVFVVDEASFLVPAALHHIDLQL
ncbi:unnamed protein product, partial [Prorocentrum cordatum]